jgi:hypothetical protein
MWSGLWRSKFFHLAMRRGPKIAKVAMARNTGGSLYWMWRQGWDYEQWNKSGWHAGAPEIALECSGSPAY